MKFFHWRLLKVFAVLCFVAFAIAATGWLVTTLWNWLLPPIFGLGPITFWQALGLFVLGRILFGGLRVAGRHRRHRFHERWRHMTPQERESFSRGLHNHCRWRQRIDTESQSRAAQG